MTNSASTENDIKSVSKITGEPLKKRGRKSKKELLQKSSEAQIQSDNIIISINEPHLLDENIDETENETNKNTTENTNENTEEPKSIKKRGRKPKGGKIIQQVVPLNNNKDVKPNIILHLKCSLKDLQKNISALGQATDKYDFMSYNEFSYDIICKIDNDTIQNNIQNKNYDYEDDYSQQNDDNELVDDYKSNNVVETKDIWKKLKSLEHNLHINNINDKKSSCFWCTCDFDNPPIYIPKHYIKDTYEVYGCFCSPECATAYLMEENIDSSDKFERYHLINHIYTKIYDYKKNIKPAPNPYYTLDKYYGNLSIQDYRSLLRSERLFLVVDKPLTRILPELHEDNDDFIINNKIIPANTYHVKKKIQRKQTKNNIVNEKFGLTSN
jgi:hypothetical protein